MPQPNDLSRSLVALGQNSTIIAVVELSQSSWLVGGVVPGIERQPRKKLEPNPERLLAQLHRWQDEAVRAGHTITRIAVAFEAERDCLVGERTRIVNRIKSTLARLGIRRFKPTLRKAADRLATVHTPEGVALPPNTLAELQRDMARLGLVVSQIRQIEEARQKRLEQQHETGPHAMVRLLARIVGIGVETADMLVHEVLTRPMRDRRAVARYAGLTGSPDESGAQRREQGLARAGNARVRRGMIQLAWRFLMFQKDSALALWYRARTADSRISTRKTMIVALARKLIIALWRLVTTGEALEGVVLRPASGKGLPERA